MTRLLDDEKVQMLIEIAEIKQDIKRIKPFAHGDSDFKKIQELEKRVQRIDKELKKHLH